MTTTSKRKKVDSGYSDDSLCKFCDLDMLNQASISCCGAKFCRVCIMIECYKEPSRRRPCPQCKKTDYIWKLDVSCINEHKGCQWRGEDIDLLKHLSLSSLTNDLEVKKCDFALVKCPECCVLLQRKDIKEHVESSCRQRIVECPNNCGWSGEMQTVKQHVKEHCVLETVKCEHCEEVLPRKNYKGHTMVHQVCPNHAKGCEWTGLCRDIRLHLNATPDKCNCLNGCDFVEIKCPYCQQHFERRELKKKFTNMERPINSEDLRKLLALSTNAQDWWYYIGLELSIDADHLNTINEDHGKAQNRYCQMLQLWLNSTPQTTWRQFVHALKAETVRRKDIAEKIEREIICNTTLSEQKKVTDKLETDGDRKVQKAEALKNRFDEYTLKKKQILRTIEVRQIEMDEVQRALEENRQSLEELITFQSRQYYNPSSDIKEDIRLTTLQVERYKDSLLKLKQAMAKDKGELEDTQAKIERCIIEMEYTLRDINKLKEKLASHVEWLKQLKSTAIVPCISSGIQLSAEASTRCSCEEVQIKTYEQLIERCMLMVKRLEDKCTSIEKLVQEIRAINLNASINSLY